MKLLNNKIFKGKRKRIIATFIACFFFIAAIQKATMNQDNEKINNEYIGEDEFEFFSCSKKSKK